MVLRREGMLSLRSSASTARASTERIVKYIAKSPAKNISSLESHTMVPTETMLGRVDRPMAGDGADVGRELE